MKTLRSGILRMAGLAALVFLMGVSTARAQAVVSQQQLVAATRIANGTWQFTYQVTVQNGPLALNAVTIVAADSSPNGTVLQNSVALGNLAANATVSANVTFQVTSAQPGSNGDYHDSFWSNYLGSLLLEVIPGPGPVAQGTISSAQGGTITVTGAGNPLNGTQVVIPPGALADPSDTITIGYANDLPAPLDPTATAAGAVSLSRLLTLDINGTSSFSQDIVVTVPYNVTALNPNDFPAVIYWDTNLGHWQPAQAIGIDKTAGTVTFITKHFSSFAVVGLRGLGNMLTGAIPFSSFLQPFDTGFRPSTDGFEAQNLSTQYNDGSQNGACYGLTSYAAWFFNNKPSPLQGLYSYYKVSGLAGNTHIPQQDAVARELIHAAFVLTFPENSAETTLELAQLSMPGSDSLTAQNLVLELQLTHSPQMVGAYYVNYPIPNPIVGAHSLLVYEWEFTPSAPAGSITFYVYDPNVPNDNVDSISWSPGGGFASYLPPNSTAAFPYIAFDAPTSHGSYANFWQFFTRAAQGWLSPAFDKLSITSPAPVSSFSYPSVGSYQINATGRTNISVTWNCTPSQIKNQDDCGTSYAHVFLNSAEWGGTPLTLGGPPLPIGPGGTIQLMIPPLTTPTSELLVAVSMVGVNTGSVTNQDDISRGYDAFLRAKLVTQYSSTTTLSANLASVPSTGGSITLTASVSSSSVPATAPAPTGTVTFVDQSGTTLCSAVALTSGFAMCATSISFAPDTITATYSGDANYAPSLSSVTVVASTAGFAGIYVGSIFWSLLNSLISPSCSYDVSVISATEVDFNSPDCPAWSFVGTGSGSSYSGEITSFIGTQFTVIATGTFTSVNSFTFTASGSGFGSANGTFTRCSPGEAGC